MTLGWWDQLAAALQAANRITEADKDDRCTDAEVRRSVVYTREDVTMAVALRKSRQLEPELLQKQPQLRLRLAVASEHELAAIGGRDVHVDQSDEP